MASDICSINIYMRNMNDYELMNEVYSSYLNFPDPPTRVCVQCPLAGNIGLIMDVVSHFCFYQFILINRLIDR